MSNDRSYVIPKWFTGIAATVLALAIPWAGWVTITLAQISVKLENQSELRKRVDSLESRFTEHIIDPAIHHSGILQVRQQIEGLDARVGRLETR